MWQIMKFTCEIDGTGIIHQDINASKSRDGLIHGRLHRSFISDVDNTWQALTAKFFDYKEEISTGLDIQKH